MEFKQINKHEYKKRVNQLQLGIVVTLLLMSLVMSEFLRLLLVSGDSHFGLNVTSVVLSVIIVAFTVYRFKHHPYWSDILYIWQLKQVLNRIYGKLRWIEEGLAADNPTAITVQFFYLKASYFVYSLEDNTLTLSDISKQLNELNEQIERLELNLSVDDFDESLLQQLAK